MQKKITLGPTLVVLVGPSAGGKSTWAKQFPENEIVSSDRLRHEFTGDQRRQDMNDLVLRVFDQRIATRLEAGLRVVADASHLRDTARRRTAKLAQRYGARLIYVVIDRPLEAKLKHAGWRSDVRVNGKELVLYQHETFQANQNKILNGDGLGALVIDSRKEIPDIVHPLNIHPYDKWPVEQAPLIDLNSRGYKGVLFVGDTHGNVEGIRKMMLYARDHGLFLIFLGDIVDYAPQTLQAADVIANLIFRGEAASILGNHEKKIFRFVTNSRTEGLFATLKGFTGEIRSGNEVTINQLKAMMPGERLAWETRFIGMCGLMPHAIRLPRYYVTHGAASPRMLTMDNFRFGDKTPEESFACYGQTSGRVVEGFNERIYDWVDEIPPRQTVVVGHDCRQETYPLIAAGKAGGRVIFLDTGSSKPDRFPDGRLSGLALEIEHKKKDGFVLVNEKIVSDRDL